MSVVATTKGVRMSPQKVRVVAALVKGRTVEDALTILEFTPRRAALAVQKTVKSARANAEHNHNYKPGSLFISQIIVTPGPRFRRFKPAARGRAMRFERATSHIRVEVDGEQRAVKKAKPAEKESEKK